MFNILKDPLFNKNEDSIGLRLRSIVLDILVTLSDKLNGALKIIENVAIVKYIISMIRSNLIQLSNLIHKV
jgi:hypothetical protein